MSLRARNNTQRAKDREENARRVREAAKTAKYANHIKTPAERRAERTGQTTPRQRSVGEQAQINAYRTAIRNSERNLWNSTMYRGNYVPTNNTDRTNNNSRRVTNTNTTNNRMRTAAELRARRQQQINDTRENYRHLVESARNSKYAHRLKTAAELRQERERRRNDRINTQRLITHQIAESEGNSPLVASARLSELMNHRGNELDPFTRFSINLTEPVVDFAYTANKSDFREIIDSGRGLRFVGATTSTNNTAQSNTKSNSTNNTKTSSTGGQRKANVRTTTATNTTSNNSAPARQAAAPARQAAAPARQAAAPAQNRNNNSAPIRTSVINQNATNQIIDHLPNENLSNIGYNDIEKEKDRERILNDIEGMRTGTLPTPLDMDTTPYNLDNLPELPSQLSRRKQRYIRKRNKALENGNERRAARFQRKLDRYND